MGIKHVFVNPKADNADDTITRPSDWNEDHTIDSDIDLGEFGLTATRLTTDYLDFNLAPSPAVVGQEGRMCWDSDDGTVVIGMPGGSVNLQLGQEELVRTRNTTGSTIPNGSVVYISGASGNKPLIALSQADAEATADSTIAMATEEIENNANGYCTTRGMVRELDTSSLTEGVKLYLSASVAGAFTDTAPAKPNHIVHIGYVIKSHATEGVVYLDIDIGEAITELHDVNVTAVADNDILVYNTSTTLWENKATRELPQDYTNNFLLMGG
jgi:hypothetical protein